MGIIVSECFATLNKTGIALSLGAKETSVTDCIAKRNLHQGIAIGEAEGSSVSGGKIIENGRHGMYMVLGSDVEIKNATIKANSQEANQTYDNIHIGAFSGNCNIEGNTIRKGALTNKPRYGIYENANAGNNRITNNDVLNGGETGDMSLNGTGTVTTAGNRT